MSDRRAGRPWSRFWETYLWNRKPDWQLDKRSSLVGTPIPSTMYETNAESCQYLLWHVARAARGVSQIFHLLFLGIGWAECVEILYAIGYSLCTCARAEIPPHRASVSQKRLVRLCSNLVSGLRVINQVPSTSHWWSASARARPFPTNVPLAVTRYRLGRLRWNLLCTFKGDRLVTAYAVITGEASPHVRTCRPRFCISGTARPIGFKFGVWVGGHYRSAVRKPWVGCIRTCARAHPFSVS